MSHKTLISWTLLLAFLLVPQNWAHGEEGMRPEDVYLQGFMNLRKVRKLEAAGEYAAAAEKCQEAGEIYMSIARRWPAWRAEMVEDRRKAVREDHQRLQQRALDEAPSLPEPVEEDGELSLPQRGAGSAPLRMNTGRGLPSGIATAPRALTPRQKFKMLEREVHRLRDDRARLLRQLQDQADHTAAANRTLGVERDKVAKMEGELAAAQEELARLEGAGVVALKNQVEELKEQLTLATSKLAEQNAHTNELLAAFEQAQEQVAELRLLTEELTQQRDEMAAIIKGLQTGDSAFELVNENSRLREQLNATQARVDELEMEKVEDETEILRLRQEISELRLELATVKEEKEAYKQRLAELQGTLDEMDGELADGIGPAASPTGRQESRLLREVIQRQLKRQAFRQQARELVIAELNDLEVGSDALIAQIDAMAEEVSLSEEEQAALGPLSPEAPSLGDDSLDRKINRFAEAAAYNFGLGRYENAAMHYEEILEFAPQHAETLCNLGVTKIHLNQVDEARALFDRAILADGTSSRAHFMHGVASFHLDQYDAAIASIEKAMKHEPNDPEFPSFLGVIHVLRSEWDQAIEALTLAVELHPRHATSHYNLSYALLKQGPPDPKRALEHYNKALQCGLAPNEEMEGYFRRLQGASGGLSAVVPASY